MALLRSVAVPSEHGGWSLTLEPVLLGLLVAPSLAGALLGCGALLLFMARTPLKIALVDRRRRRVTSRAQLAMLVVAVEGLIVAVLVLVATRGAESGFWKPLLAAAPLVAIELWYDMRSRSRRLIPELAGSIGIGSVAAAVALAGGADPTVAAGLWLVMGARAVAAIAFVRVELRRAKAQPHRLIASDVGQTVAVAAVTVGWFGGLVPPVAICVMAAVGVFALVMVRRPPVVAVVLGVQQVVIGLIVVLTVGISIALA